jgi:hypothetical protein
MEAFLFRRPHQLLGARVDEESKEEPRDSALNRGFFTDRIAGTPVPKKDQDMGQQLLEPLKMRKTELVKRLEPLEKDGTSGSDRLGR